MGSELLNALSVSASGMRAQGTRIRVISENIANANSTASEPGGDPFRRQQITFANELDRELGVNKVKVDDISDDMEKPFKLEFAPDHPAANADGYVKKSNVNTLVEMMDMREAQRTYEANLGMIQQSRTMITRTIDLLRA